jgi:hypothetical protein
MGVVARPSQVILLVEDRRHEQFIYRYLRKQGFERHAMRTVKSPSAAGSAEQWVRERFAIEVEACRGRQAETRLIVLIDADTQPVRERIAQLDKALREAGAALIPDDTKEIARLVPKRNIETWILCLNDVEVNEDRDYKRTRDNWTELVRTAVSNLYVWTRPRAALPPSCVESLQIGIGELRRLGL